MFTKTRLKLTAWYLLIIMLISISFSAVVYHALTFEFNRILRIEKLREEGKLFPPRPGFIIPFRDDVPRHGIHMSAPNPEVIQEAKNRLLYILGIINGGILIFSGTAGYFLAGRTLRPIKEMIDEQNRFITDASHELRTPLTILRSELEVVLRNKQITAKEAQELLNSNLEEVKNIQMLSDELLQLAQFQKPLQTSMFSELNVFTVIASATKKLKLLALKKKITIKNNVDKNIKIVGEEKSLVELFTILIDNAIKYSSLPSTITIQSETGKNHVEIYVIDEGIGIDKKDFPYIFDRFYRANKSRSKQNVAGYGLGLAIAKKIVEFHQGTIQIKSTPHKGSTFTVYLPTKHS